MNDRPLNRLLRIEGGPDRPLVVGMVHLRALPGSPAFDGDREAIRDAMLRDARALVEGGVDALLLENFGDRPFHPRRVPRHVVADLTALAAIVRRRFDVPLGINVLRNDSVSALSVAAAAGASFIRVNVLCGARLTDQGIVTGHAHRLLRYRRRLDCDVSILADVDVKHSVPLVDQDIGRQVADLTSRGGADALIVSGAATGAPVDHDELDRVVAAAQGAPVLIGSGATPEQLPALRAAVAGFVVGTALKEDGVVANPVCPRRVRAFMRALETDEEPASLGD